MELTALRLATVAALLNGGNEPYPTIAGPFVYDSLIDDVSDLLATQRRPTIIVRTDDDVTTYNRNAFAGRTGRLLIEAGVLTAATVVIGGQEKLRVDWPRTDPTLELMLDILVWQIWNALHGAGDWAVWYRSVGFGNIQRKSSVPRFTPPQKGTVRQAVRTIDLSQTLADECLPTALNELDVTPDTPPFLPPNLTRVLNYIYEKGAGDFRTGAIELGKTLARYGSTVRPVYPPFERMWSVLGNFDFELKPGDVIDEGTPVGLLAQWDIPQTEGDQNG
jgi:hypothetical protein